MQIVAPGSAGFLGTQADEIPNTDHHTICAFSRPTDNSFDMVIERMEVLTQKVDDLVDTRNRGSTFDDVSALQLLKRWLSS
jgi:hypothetical protein